MEVKEISNDSEDSEDSEEEVDWEDGEDWKDDADSEEGGDWQEGEEETRNIFELLDLEEKQNDRNILKVMAAIDEINEEHYYV